VKNPPVTITGSFGVECVEGKTVFQLNEPAGSATAADETGFITGVVNDPSETFLGDGYFHGDGNDNYIDFSDNPGCLRASTELTLAVRVKPFLVDNGTDANRYRIFQKGPNNYYLHVWRLTTAEWLPTYNPPPGVGSITFVVRVLDKHGGTNWRPVITDYRNYPIVADHWYDIKVVWNSNKVGGIPGDIFVDDQGTDGNGAGENWSGFKNATDSNQEQLPDRWKLYEGDEIRDADAPFVIGAANPPSYNVPFNGLIDWISVELAADYSGVEP
jgi:hypothetical protein